MLNMFQGKLAALPSKEAEKIFQNTRGSKGTNRTNNFAVN